MIEDDCIFSQELHNLSRVHFMDMGFMLPAGDPSLRGGNGIPPRCVYLEEMAADLDGQDWLDMDNIEQVRRHGSHPFPLALFLPSSIHNTFYVLYFPDYKPLLIFATF